LRRRLGAWPVALRIAAGQPLSRRRWQRFPFNMYAHAFLSIERWWEAATPASGRQQAA
jgi:hypothetical protein